jgi:ATP-dependent helicase/DNAse subunit B
MSKDTYSAVWVSHTSISDYLKCPRAYYLKNVYKDPQTNHKIQIMSPALALGQSVHEVLENLSTLPTQERLRESLITRFQQVWKKVSGKRGGFTNPETEEKYMRRGENMLRRVMEHPGPITRLAVKIKQDLPSYWLSEVDNIRLCGKIDWLEYHPDEDSVSIVDFKTGKSEEDAQSLQLPIYRLLVQNCQHRKVSHAYYWYLDLQDEMVEKELPDLEEAEELVLAAAKQVKLARQLEVFKCSKGGCMHCKPFEKILRGEAELVGVNDYNQDIYILNEAANSMPESIIL